MTEPGAGGPGDAGPVGGERLQKVLARAGLGSRRTCEALIDAGRVRVNGEVAVLGRRIDPDHDRVSVDGVTVAVRPGLVYYVLNKPAKVVTTAHDPEGRPTVVDLDDGLTAPARVRVAQTIPTGAALEIVIHEGRNRQVRRMCEAVGHPVRRLVRTRFGPLRDQRLAPGQWRPLSPSEIRALYEATSLKFGDAEDDSEV